MNIFDKTNDKMNNCISTCLILDAEFKTVEFSINEFNISIDFKTEGDNKFISINIDDSRDCNVRFDNDNQDSVINLSSRLFYKKCKSNFNDFEHKAVILNEILVRVCKELSKITTDISQSERAFLNNFDGFPQ